MNANVPESVNCPMLLPNKGRFSMLVIQDAHRKVLHQGVRDTLTELRETYWIPQGRKAVQRILKRCVKCLKQYGKSFDVDVPPPPLPAMRVTEGAAFQFTGIDFAGPLIVKSRFPNDTNVKRYICLFTCAVVRAVHLEVVEDLSTPAFLRSFRRFISRRGIPEIVLSDNAKTFKAAANVLEAHASEILATAEAQNFLFNNGIRWNFIPERTPWWGGFYERMVGTVKRCLKKTIGKALLSNEELCTVIPEVEAVVNSRPITYVYSEPGDGAPLTPSHFLCGKRVLTLPEPSKERIDDPEWVPESGRKTIERRYTLICRNMKTFWRCWRKEYLVNLREFDQIKAKKTHKAVPMVGDVGILKDQQPRSRWKLCRIEEVFPGKDKVVRVVKVRCSDGNEFRRPIQHVYPLEVRHDASSSDERKGEEGDQSPQSLDFGSSKKDARPRRNAFIEARHKLLANRGGEDVESS